MKYIDHISKVNANISGLKVTSKLIVCGKKQTIPRVSRMFFKEIWYILSKKNNPTSPIIKI
jgi:hypothetical protein